ncbi:MAG: DUF1028 domain-containing protein [Planctomycetota bacterium]
MKTLPRRMMLVLFVVACCTAAVAPGCAAPTPGGGGPAAGELPIVSTFSIVALDPATGDLGIAVTSKFLAVGSVVPYAEAGVGAVATQARANVTYGPAVLRLLRDGKTAAEAVAAVTGADAQSAQRQLGAVDAHGRAATFTGASCMNWAGGRTGRYCAVQGNILVDEKTVAAVIATFEASEGKATLARRLVDALLAGYRAGGDKRSGPSNPLDLDSAALLVVRAEGGYDGGNDRFVDLRVDNQAQPVEQLQDLLALHERIWRAYHERRPANPIKPEKPQTPGDGEEDF